MTLELPAGDPVVLPIGTHTWTSGDHPVVQIDFEETHNEPPCDPEIQVTETNCDDRFAINDELLAPAPVTVDGVTFTFTHLGFKDPDGTFDAPLITEELQTTAGSFFAQITASSNPTSTSLTVGEGPKLTAAISPVPWTGDGAVEFRADGQAIGSCTNVEADPESGAATCTPGALKPGTHSVKASYSGGVGFAASESDAVELVIPLPPFALKVNRAKLRKALRSGLVVKVVGAEAGRLKLIAKKGPKAVAAGATQIGETGEGSVKLKFKRWAKKKFADAKRLRLKISGGGGQTKVTLRR